MQCRYQVVMNIAILAGGFGVVGYNGKESDGGTLRMMMMMMMM